MDLDQAGAAPGAPESRTAAFSTGLSEASASQNAMVPRGFVQTSLLQQQLPSANGMAQRDYQRVLPGSQGGRPIVLPSSNGTSAKTYEDNTIMRLQAQFVI